MIALIQRVSRAHVEIEEQRVAEIGAGLLALVAATPDDTPARARQLARRVLAYRVFADAQGRMNHSVASVGAGVLAVPQFTLAADTTRGNRPGFSTACPPDRAAPLFEDFMAALADHPGPVARGRFGADMQVGLINDGPVTFWLEH